jgi:UDPglucose--hexose-1-phosphate uridylyltransferase
MDRTELRLDPLTKAWTMFSEARAIRPAYGAVRDDPAGADVFSAGREEFTPQTLHQSESNGGWQVRVVPNRTPVLRVEGDATPRSDGFYDHMDGVGAHEVIIEDPGQRALHELQLSDIERVIDAWKLRMLDLMRDPRMRTLLIVRNIGRAAGATVAHSISQLVAMAVIPTLLRRKLDTAREFFAAKKRSIFEDILADEVRVNLRLVYENNGFTVFCPYASRAPFELAIYPKRQCPDFHGLSDQERAQLADVLKTALSKLSTALDQPPYNLMLTTAPTRTPRHDEWNTIEQDFRWHIEILPRLQHLGGIELATGCWINSVWPEVAAGYLRATRESVPLSA